MRRLSTGELVAPWVTRFAYPFRWFYSVLNAADYFRAASLLDGTPPDPRMADAIEAIRAAAAAGRHLAPGATAPGSGVVRGRRAGGRAVEVAHPVRHARPGVVGRVVAAGRFMVTIDLSRHAEPPSTGSCRRRDPWRLRLGPRR